MQEPLTLEQAAKAINDAKGALSGNLRAIVAKQDALDALLKSYERMHNERLAPVARVIDLEAQLLAWLWQIKDSTPIVMINGVPHAKYDDASPPIALTQPTDRLWATARAIEERRKGATEVQPAPENEKPAPSEAGSKSNNRSDLR